MEREAYAIYAVITAAIVPTARDREGFFKSPDIAIPDSIPVVAGKKRAKAAQKVMDVFVEAVASVSGTRELPPMNTEIMAAITMQKINPWVLRAKSTGKRATTARPANVQISRDIKEIWGTNS